MPTSASTLAERSRREVEVLAALAQLERDLQLVSSTEYQAGDTARR